MDGIYATERLVLRPLNLTDAPAVSRLAGRRELADTTISIPHPYSVAQAEQWIASHAPKPDSPAPITFGIVAKTENQLIGAVGLREINPDHRKAELSIWIGVDWWGHGYATEAAAAMLRYGFTELELNRIEAHHMVRNPASGRVLEKIGLKPEGLLRQHVCKWGVFEDVVLLAILRENWLRPVLSDESRTQCQK